MNTNCLEGRACPDCGQDDEVHITATSVFVMVDDGTDEFGDVEYDETSPASCPQCEFEGTWGDFNVENQETDPDEVHTPIMGWLSCRYVYEMDDEAGKIYRCTVHGSMNIGHQTSCENAGEKWTAHFQPQAWVANHAMDVDDEGENTWDCTGYVGQHRDYVEELEGTDDEFLDNDDVFKNDPAAPEWVREWRGPFTITLTKGSQE